MMLKKYIASALLIFTLILVGNFAFTQTVFPVAQAANPITIQLDANVENDAKKINSATGNLTVVVESLKGFTVNWIAKNATACAIFPENGNIDYKYKPTDLFTFPENYFDTGNYVWTVRCINKNTNEPAVSNLVRITIVAPGTSWRTTGVQGNSVVNAEFDANVAACANTPTQSNWDLLKHPVQAIGAGITSIFGCCAQKILRGDFLGGLVCFINDQISKVIVFLIEISTYFVGFTSKLTQTINGDSSNFARGGFNASRDIVNLLFVVAIIYIAFKVMFRQANDIKTAIVKIVIAAIFVNFSFMIALELLKFSDLIMNVFLSAIETSKNSWTNIGNMIIGNIGPGVNNPDIVISADSVQLLSPFFLIVFGFIAIFTFFAIAALFVVRYVEIAILLVILPFAILAYAFPGQEGLWDKWWKKFSSWLFFGPTVMFFMYLAVMILSGANNMQITNESSPALSGISNMIIVLGLMLGGLYAGKEIGVTGTKQVEGYFNKAKAWGAGRAKMFGERVKTSAYNWERGPLSTKKFLGGLQKAPLIGGVGMAAEGFLSKGQTAVQKDTRKFDDMSKDQLKRALPALLSASTRNLKPGESVAAIQAATKNGAWKDFIKENPEFIQKFPMLESHYKSIGADTKELEGAFGFSSDSYKSFNNALSTGDFTKFGEDQLKHLSKQKPEKFKESGYVDIINQIADNIRKTDEIKADEFLKGALGQLSKTPALAAAVMPTMSSADLNKFATELEIGVQKLNTEQKDKFDSVIEGALAKNSGTIELDVKRLKAAGAEPNRITKSQREKMEKEAEKQIKKQTQTDTAALRDTALKAEIAKKEAYEAMKKTEEKRANKL